MEWLFYLLLLACPIIMIFMMKGHSHGGHGHYHSQSSKNIDTKMSHLEKENEKLRKEIDSLSSMIKKES